MQLAIKQETISRLDEIANNYQLARIETSPFSASISTALAINELRALLTPEVMRPIMALMNSPLGFLTDRTGRPNWKGEAKPLYPEETIKDVVIEATLRGFFPVGNEFNVIADRFYAAKNGLRRKVSTHPGLTEFKDTYAVPKIVGENGALVEAKATWKLNGRPDELVRTFAVKGDKFAGADAYIGKATRKLLAAVLERVSGVSVPDGEAEDVDFTSMKAAEGREVNYDSAHEREMDLWRRDCQATEEYNAKLKAQGIPEDQWEPMPPMPAASDAAEAVEAEPDAEAPKEEIPWREVVALNQFKSISGKKLGDLPLNVLEKVRDAINRQSSTVRASKPGTVELLAAVCKGIKELTPVPAKATPLEGLQNLIDRSGVTDEAVLKMATETFDITPKTLEDLSEEHIKAIIASWPDAVAQLKGNSN